VSCENRQPGQGKPNGLAFEHLFCRTGRRYNGWMGQPGEVGDLLTGAKVRVGVLATALVFATNNGDEKTAEWLRPQLASATKFLEETNAELRRSGHSEGQLRGSDRPDKPGVVKRAGVVLGVTMTDEGSLFRTGWYDRETPNVHAKESSVKIDGLVLIDPNSLPNNIRNILEYVKTRGTVS
jgi:hypothetical protein